MIKKRLNISGGLVVGHRLTSFCVLFFHVVGKLFCQQVEKVSAAVESAHLYLIEFFIYVVFGYLHIKGFGKSEDYILHGEPVAEAFCKMEGVADFHERDFLVAPFQSYVLKKLIVGCRFDDDIL